MVKGKKIDNETKVKAITSYAKTGNYSETAREVGIHDKTVKKAVMENPKLYEQKKSEFIEKATKIIDKAMDNLDKALDKDDIPVNNLTTVIGTLYDKRALAKGEATTNTTFKVDINVIE